MLSYHNDPAVKEKFQLRFAAHRAADEVIQGMGFDNGRGCFVGCAIDNYDHAQFPKELGWPVWLAHLADKIFEGIQKSEAAQFGTDLLEAVPVGIDLENVQFMIAIVRHTKQLESLKNNKESYAEECRNALQGVITYCKNKIDNGFNDVETKSARLAQSVAWSAESAAWSAESSAESTKSAAKSAKSAAKSAAWSAWSAAKSAAESTAKSAAKSAAWSADSAAASSSSWKEERDVLLSTIRSLKP